MNAIRVKDVVQFLHRHSTKIWVAVVLLVIEWAYAWFFTAGTLTKWDIIHGAYYDWQADAFRAGQLHVLQPPNPELLTKEDPYDPIHARLWLGDLSLYDGKYYLYWGPVPGAIQAVVKAAFSINRTIGDQYLAFGFISVAGISAALFVYRLATQLFRNLPAVVVAVAMFTVALAHPVLHLLDNGNVYVVAIAGGQAFLVLSIFFSSEAILSRSSRMRWSLLFAASVAGGLSMGCRASMAPALVIVLVSAGLFAQPLRQTPLRQTLISAVCALGPAGAAGLGLLYYNWVRFDDFLEFGTNIQTGPFPFSFSFEQFPPNLYSYLARTPTVSCHFPYIFQQWYPTEGVFPPSFELPENYLINEPVVGLLIATPFLVLAPLAFLRSTHAASPIEKRAYRFALVVLLACGILPGITPLGLYMATMRYQGDIIFGACLLSVLGFFCLWDRRHSVRYLVPASLGAYLAVHSVVLSLILGYQSYAGHVYLRNPELDQRLRKVLSVCPPEEPPFPRFSPYFDPNKK